MDPGRTIRLILPALLLSAASLACGADTVQVPAGTALTVELETALAADTAAVRDEVSARLAGNLTAGDRVLIPAGAVLRGRVTAVQAADDRRPAAVKLDFRVLETGGRVDSVSVRITGAEAVTEEPEDGAAPGVAGTGIAGTVVEGRQHAPMVVRELARAPGTGILLGTPAQPAHLPAGARLELELTEPLEVVPAAPAK